MFLLSIDFFVGFDRVDRLTGCYNEFSSCPFAGDDHRQFDMLKWIDRLVMLGLAGTEAI